MVTAFGAFQTYYRAGFLKDETPSDISWVGSMQAFLLLFAGFLAGPAFDAGYFRHLLGAGAFLTTFGLMMTSLCHEYWQVLLAQGFCVGVGYGCAYIPTVSNIPSYFLKRRAIAYGLLATGTSFGGVVYPILFNKLQPRIGFPWTTRIMAFVNLALFAVTMAVTKVRTLPRQKRSLFQISAFEEVPFTLYCAAILFGFIGFLGPGMSDPS